MPIETRVRIQPRIYRLLIHKLKDSDQTPQDIVNHLVMLYVYDMVNMRGEVSPNAPTVKDVKVAVENTIITELLDGSSLFEWD